METTTVGFPRAVLLTGISAAGKSTIAQALAERLPRSVHLRGDTFRRMIVNDRADIGPDQRPEAVDLLRLRYQLTARALDTYASAGFTVIAQDVVLGPLLADVVAAIETRPLAVVALCPSVESVREREVGRAKTGYGEWTVDELDHVLRERTPRLGLWLDTSTSSVDDTVAEILRRVPGEGLVD